MKISTTQDKLIDFCNGLKKKYIDKEVSAPTDDALSWQYDILDEFERSFLSYDKCDIDNNNFLKQVSFVDGNDVKIELYKPFSDKKEFGLTIKLIEATGKIHKRIIKDIKIDSYE